MLQIKKGAVVILNERTAPIVEVMLDEFTKLGKDCVITSGAEGVHSDGSIHYTLGALDFRGRHLTPTQRNHVVAQAQKRLGADYDVVRSNHGAIHIEHDPK